MRPLFWLLGFLGLLSTSGMASAQTDAAAPTPFGAEELEQIVAPIALYPDSLLAQVFMASTYPLEVVEAARWVKANPKLKDKALEDALQSQTWDPSVKSLTAFPPVLEMMSEKLDWTQKLGDAFLAQQGDVMSAVQRLRAKAQAEGNLESNEEQKVVVEQPPASGGDTTIVIQPANPQVVYVPTYNPTVVYGAWPYPSYPPYYYYPPGYAVASSMISFGVGMAVGAALWGDCDWGWDNHHGGDYGGHNKVNINVNNYNNFNKTNIKNGNWNHNAEHRKGVGYRDKGTQDRFGKGQRPGTANREAFRGRAEQGRRDIAKQGTGAVQRDLAKGTRPTGGATRPGAAGQGSGVKRPGGAAGQLGSAGKASGAGRGGSLDRGRSSSGFEGIGHGSQVRRESSRGHASRERAGMSGSRSMGGGGGRRRRARRRRARRRRPALGEPNMVVETGRSQREP